MDKEMIQTVTISYQKKDGSHHEAVFSGLVQMREDEILLVKGIKVLDVELSEEYKMESVIPKN